MKFIEIYLKNQNIKQTIDDDWKQKIIEVELPKSKISILPTYYFKNLT